MIMDMTDINRDKYITTYNNSKYLVLSSFSFTIPSIYAFYNSMYFHACILLLTSLISANYWRKPRYSWRRDLDLFFSKLSFVIFTYDGIVNIKNNSYTIIAYPLFFIMLYCYYLSNTQFKIKNSNNWVIYHSLFHYSVMCEQLIILDSILPKCITY